MPRMNPAHRKAMIRNNARLLASEIGVANLTFANVAERCPVATSEGTVRHYFTYLSDLQMEACGDDPALLVQAIAMGIISD